MSDPNYPQTPQQPYQQPYGQQPQPYQQPQQQYAQQPYGQQPQYYAPQYAQPTVPTNSMAIVALISGITGLTIFFFVGSIVAVIVGPMARKRIKETGEGGDGMALAGIIMGWVGVVLGALGLIFAVILPLIFVASAGTIN